MILDKTAFESYQIYFKIEALQSKHENDLDEKSKRKLQQLLDEVKIIYLKIAHEFNDGTRLKDTVSVYSQRAKDVERKVSELVHGL